MVFDKSICNKKGILLVGFLFYSKLSLVRSSKRCCMYVVCSKINDALGSQIGQVGQVADHEGHGHVSRRDHQAGLHAEINGQRRLAARGALRPRRGK